MKLELLIDSTEFWPRLREDILSARHSVRVQTYSFEGDRAGKMLAEALLSIESVDVDILVDSWSKLVLSDKFLYWPKNLFDAELRSEVVETRRMVDRLRNAGVRVGYTNPVGFFLSKFPNRNHKKLVLIDDTISYVGGINFSEHNFEWHDMMIRIDDRGVSQFLTTDFDNTRLGGTLPVQSGSFGDIDIHLANGRLNEGQFAKIFKVIDGAEKQIQVHMPYMTGPFLDKLEEAKRRGVNVTLIAPRRNNYIFVGGSVVWRCAKSGLDLRLYDGRMTHLKAMLVDGEVLIAGSTNFDFFSYGHHEEILVVVRNKPLIDDFVERILNRDLEHCRVADGAARSRTGRLEDFAVRSARTLLGWTRPRSE